MLSITDVAKSKAIELREDGIMGYELK